MAAKDLSYGKILYNDSPKKAIRVAFNRFLLLILMMVVTGLIFYFDRHGLRDMANPDKPVDLIGVIYFTIVTVTTLGYGDIVPVTREARLFDAFFVTAVRIFSYLVILTTAFELALPKLMEGFMIKKLKERINNHTIIVGLGRTGMEVLENLLRRGEDPKQIVVIDNQEDRTILAAEMGVSALRGNAETEKILNMADIKDAKRILLCAGQDHTNLMVCLTTRSLNKKVEIVAMAREKENAKIFIQGGADRVISMPELLSHEMLKEKEKPPEEDPEEV